MANLTFFSVVGVHEFCYTGLFNASLYTAAYAAFTKRVYIFCFGTDSERYLYHLNCWIGSLRAKTCRPMQAL